MIGALALGAFVAALAVLGAVILAQTTGAAALVLEADKTYKHIK